jgi:hypothetical protein
MGDKADVGTTGPREIHAFPRGKCAIVHWCLRVAAKTRLILFAGALNNRVYLNEFIGSMNREGLRLDGEPKRQGPGFVCVHTLYVDGRAIPAFFCSVSPSSRTKGLLPARVAEHQDLLRSFLGGQSSSNNPLRPMRACGPRC